MTKAVCVRLPKLGANVGEGMVNAWRRREGDRVRAGEPLVEIVTSKATFEVESPRDGMLRRVLAPERSHVPVGYVLALVGEAAADLPEVRAENDELVAAFRSRADSGGAVGGGARAGPMWKVKATPGARRLARGLGVDLGTVRLPEGVKVVREEDVRKAAEG